MTQVKQGHPTFTTPGSSHRQEQHGATCPHILTVAPCFPDELLLSSTKILSQNASGRSFPEGHSSHRTAQPKGRQSWSCWVNPSQSQYWELPWGSPHSSAPIRVPQELLTPLCPFPIARERLRPQVWPWHEALPIPAALASSTSSLAACWDQRPPPRPLLRPSLRGTGGQPL